MTNLFFGVSLLASFLGGVVALFAPCCITFLFPSYLGTIFKEKGRVVFLTLVFALGLGTILVPVALGMKVIVTLFDEFHSTTYLLGAFTMFLVGLMTLFEIKLSLPLPHYVMPQRTTTFSTFVLGIFSGITSSCCAPVLFAAITLSSLSPTVLGSLIVSLVYVLGIVFPLFFLSLFYEKLSNKYLFNIRKSLEKPLKIIASLTFMASSLIITFLTLTNRIQMDENKIYGLALRQSIFNLSDKLQNPLFDIFFLIILAFLFKLIIGEIRQERKQNDNRKP